MAKITGAHTAAAASATPSASPTTSGSAGTNGTGGTVTVPPNAPYGTPSVH